MKCEDATRKVRECTNRYLIYFAFTGITKKIKTDSKGKGGKEVYDIYYSWDVFGSDNLEDINEHKELLLSLVSETNSYILVVVDKVEQKFISRTRKILKLNNILDHYHITVSSLDIGGGIKWRVVDGNKIVPITGFTWGNRLGELDFFFRGPSEIPPNYEWDEGEFQGWLQFRWGDGKNAIPKESLITV